jgi:hypothetical protein
MKKTANLQFYSEDCSGTSLETSAYFYRATYRYSPECSAFHRHRCGSLKSDVLGLIKIFREVT